MTWKDMIDGAYLTLLEGFSRIPCCSTEGRALMSIDLASFAAGTDPAAVMERLDYNNDCDKPPTVDRERYIFVDTYIKLYYYPKKDVMAWIIENHERYHLNHCLTLAANAYRGDGSATVEQIVEMVKGIFHEDEDKDDVQEASSRPHGYVSSQHSRAQASVNQV